MGSPLLQQALDTNRQQREQQAADQQAVRDVAIQSRSLAIGGLRQKLANIDPQKNPNEYASTVDQIQQQIHGMREILAPDQKLGVGDWLKMHTTDRLHITNHDARVRELAAKNTAGVNQDEATAHAIAVGSPYSNPYADKYHQLTALGISPEEALQLATGSGPKTEQEKFIRDYMSQHKGSTEEDALKAWTVATTKVSASAGTPIKGTMVRSRQSPTGYAQTWVSRTNPNQIVAWQPISPSRWYIGFSTSSSTTDPFGVVSTSQHVMNPAETGEVDLSGAMQMPPETGSQIQPGPSGPASPAPNIAAPPPAAAPAAGRGKVRGAMKPTLAATGSSTPLPLDANGHIPESSGINPMVRSAANQLLDGVDIDKLTIPQRDRQMAATVAARYGWGQGTYTPKEKVLINEAVAKLDQLGKSPSLKVLDSALSREKIAVVLRATQGREGFMGSIISPLMAGRLSKPEQEFLRDYNAVVGVIAGLGPITRGNRSTEASINRLMIELPSVLQSGSSEDAKQRIAQLLQEVQVAVGTKGNTPVGGNTGPNVGDRKTFPNGKVGVWDGQGWVAQN